jgi:hypothetical protein
MVAGSGNRARHIIILVTGMSAQSDPLSFEEHRQMSAELRLMAARLRELYVLAQDVYGAESPAVARFAEALESLARVRSEMQAQSAADLPEYQAGGLYE